MFDSLRIVAATCDLIDGHIDKTSIVSLYQWDPGLIEMIGETAVRASALAKLEIKEGDEPKEPVYVFHETVGDTSMVLLLWHVDSDLPLHTANNGQKSLFLNNEYPLLHEVDLRKNFAFDCAVSCDVLRKDRKTIFSHRIPGSPQNPKLPV